MLEDNYFTKEYIFDKIPIRFMLTEKCNLRCHMCSADGLGIGKVNCNQSKEMNLEKAKILVDLLSEINYSGEITFSGGEPMVYPYFYELIEYIFKKQ
jgi:molybdenum cofactor biosynthesis enzyme MoaA